jgi:hypothetical protein
MRNYYLVTVIYDNHQANARLMTNKRQALRAARFHRGLLYQAPQATFAGGTQYGIDGPTFRAQANIIADYRNLAGV